jgi:hypothetical protein
MAKSDAGMANRSVTWRGDDLGKVTGGERWRLRKRAQGVSYVLSHEDLYCKICQVTLEIAMDF